MVALPDISKGMNNIIGYALVIAGVLSAAFYVVVSSRFIKCFDPVTLLSGQLIFFFVLSSIFVLIAKPSICLPLDSVVLVFCRGCCNIFFLAFVFILIHCVGFRFILQGQCCILFHWLRYFCHGCFWMRRSHLYRGGVIVTVFSVYSLNKKYSES